MVHYKSIRVKPEAFKCGSDTKVSELPDSENAQSFAILEVTIRFGLHRRSDEVWIAVPESLGRNFLKRFNQGDVFVLAARTLLEMPLDAIRAIRISSLVHSKLDELADLPKAIIAGQLIRFGGSDQSNECPNLILVFA